MNTIDFLWCTVYFIGIFNAVTPTPEYVQSLTHAAYVFPNDGDLNIMIEINRTERERKGRRKTERKRGGERGREEKMESRSKEKRCKDA